MNQFISYTGVKVVSWSKTVFSTNSADQLDIHMQENDTNQSVHQ